MAVTPAAQRGVLGLACRIKLNGDTRPVVHGVSEPVTAGLPSDDNAALAGLLGDGGDSGQTAQSGVVAPFNILRAVPAFGSGSALQAYQHISGRLDDAEVQAVPKQQAAGRNLLAEGLPEMPATLRTLETWDDKRVCLMGAV